MKILRLQLFFLLLSGFCNFLMASPTNKEVALQKAQQFYAGKVNQGLRSSVDLSLVYTDNGNAANEPAGFYIFNAGNEDGFIMVSGDDIAKPVLAYSEHGSFSKDIIPENLKCWLDFYHKEMQAVIKNNVVKSIEKTVNLRNSTHSAVQPLLGGLKWGQDNPFNLLCPLSEDSSERTLVGCVATAMAQVMKYHQWPVKSSGVFEEYKENNDKEEETLRIDTFYTNFGETIYSWEEMLDLYNGTSTLTQDSAVAVLCYHIGVSVNTVYGVANEGGSGAFSNDIGNALVKYFGYDPDLRYLTRDYYDQSTWSELLKDELDAGRPILYGGTDESSGHEFVCDGYDSEGFFHFNWGWKGVGDGYYALSVVDPNLVINGHSSGGYVTSQDAVIGIRKDDGVKNPEPFFEINMYNNISSDKTGISSISNEIFGINFGWANLGYNTFSGYMGVGIYKDDTIIKILGFEKLNNINSYYGELDQQFDSLSLSGINNGDYRIYALYRPDGSNSWFKIKEKTYINNCLNVCIVGDSATISAIYNGPEFIQTSAIQAKGDIYQHKPCSFSVTIKNNGQEFNSYMALYIKSTTDSTKKTYLGSVITLIPKGETKTLEFSGIISLDSGLYNASVVYISMSNYSDYEYKLVDKAGFTPMQFKLNYYPRPELTLSKRLYIVGGDSIYQNKEFGLNVSFKNLGSVYDNEVAIQLYPSDPGYQLGQTGITPIVVDSGATKEFTLKGSFDNEPGIYRIFVFATTKNGSWNYVRPTSLIQSVYTSFIRIKIVADPMKLDKVETKSVYLRINPVEESIEIITDEVVLQAVIFDINGRKLGQYRNQKILPAGELEKGIYFLQVTTNRGITNVRFIK